ncbi:Aldehyde dehydrogenase family 2 member C4 [Triticum urartu]|uniref:aldehyde dehydrogenase (NAD(+)) n=2 Tax=Triticum TaxID=4564 RepID=A0A9R0ZH15_TRITD|nr:Aldehyde dehydrogenase family 2 member C4 [Triticum urartu]VAI77791.1 unnamed protein product [Triticum turgidum subsp. durum]
MASERNGDGGKARAAENGNGGGSGVPMEMPEIRHTKLFINGAFVDAVSGKTFETRDPRTGDVIASIAEGDKKDVDLAVKGHTLREPMGVAGLIIPWNFPAIMFFSKVAPALAAGCTMVVKPAEQTPLSALYFAHLAKQAGVPDGVINVITGFGPTAGAAIASHMDVDMVSFTGSTAVGRLIMEASARSNLKPVSLELGGKSPLIIFDDADVDMAVGLAIAANFFNKGIYDRFVKKLAQRMESWVVGDPFDPRVNQGPQVDKAQYERVLGFIDHGKREGATVLTGGKPFGQRGYYIEPTVFTDVKDDMIIAKEEIFGPVMCLMKFTSVEEAIARANDTRYGLAAGVVTKDINVANRMARSIRAGVVWVNCYFAMDSDCPFGGRKMSGFGKDDGMHALDKFLAVKSVVTPVYDSPWL